MRRFIWLLLLFLTGFQVKSQFGYEDFYSPQDLESILQWAKTPIEQIDACGFLAVHYQGVQQDSLADFYYNKIFKIPIPPNNVEVTARTLWWDMKYSSNEEKAHTYLQFAEDHNLGLHKMAAHLLLSEHYIHSDLTQAEKHVLIAKDILANWERDTLAKDSIRLEFYSTAAHVYVHKRDGARIINYLLPIVDYAEQDKSESLKVLAITKLAELYAHWTGQEKKAFPWANKQYENFKRTNQPNQLLSATCQLALLYIKHSDKDSAILYFTELENLMDSLQAYGYYQYYVALNKEFYGLLTSHQMIQLLDNDFNHHLFLRPDWTAKTKAEIYFRGGQWDSLVLYLSKVKEIKGDSSVKNDYTYNKLLALYYLHKKDYATAITILKEQLQRAQKEGNLPTINNTFYHLSKAHEGRKEYKIANEYLWDFIQSKDSLVKLDNKDEVASMEMQKQLALQEEVYHDQQIQQEAEQARIALRNTYWITGLFTGLAVLLLVAGLLWRNNREKQKSKLAIMKAYQELKITQNQLIQSEKMASLGELTAGIAHEIQNPLNFVNNFSEVSNELLEEMKDELAIGHQQQAMVIAEGVKENLDKIIHHGKRADAIVKGMLMHSRTSTGVKEPTDINALCDEYLRLAYHGLRAKDRTFNATMKTDFDPSIGKINVVPQDIGRVILNLITNAFYAVSAEALAKADAVSAAASAKVDAVSHITPQPPNTSTSLSNRGGLPYVPIVSVTTKRKGSPSGDLGVNGGTIEILVRDNGPGIPDSIKDKIFQPFFTTKPTGQGTGLGLSLSYDIIKAHGGDVKLETKEGEFTEFKIILPI